MSRRRVLVFVPAWNEEASVGDVVRALRLELPQADVLVIDDGSVDATSARAREAGALVLTLPFHRGLGAALQTGYRFAARNGYAVVAHCDADGQHPPPEVARLVEVVEAGEADLVLGSRFVNGGGGAGGADVYRPSIARRIGIRFFVRLLSAATGRRFTDTTSGLRACNHRVIALFAERYGADYPELESLLRAVRNGLRVVELPVTMRPRVAGKSKITPARTAFWVFNGVVSLSAEWMRPRAGADERSLT
jgi:glycosyltransferase involved in cell wall biosynthesis